MASIRVSGDSSRIGKGATLSRSREGGGEFEEYAQMFEDLFGEDLEGTEGEEDFDWDALWQQFLGEAGGETEGVEEPEEYSRSHILPGYRSGIYYD